eukprot:TRINITY_DN1872_c0_g1_i14.p1 TRINITY_DN1872_c0_g1~~TRINITY_DN1872_c0_g1_i14.p1  ORF type:complete len:259 (+),score=71.93 TRINITY_DN1872_c0_g1_i14:328-1104(+)
MDKLRLYKSQLDAVEAALREGSAESELQSVAAELWELIDMQQELIQEGEDEESDDDIFASETKTKKRKREDSPKSADVQEAEAAAPELVEEEEEEVESGTVQASGENVPSPMESFDVTFEERDKTMLQNIKRANYSNPTLVQRYSIPAILAKRDLLASAETGSGKTASYLIPMITNLMAESQTKKLLSYHKSFPSILILAPTRELAVQIHQEVEKFTEGNNLQSAVIYGGTDYATQAREIDLGCDILGDSRLELLLTR